MKLIVAPAAAADIERLAAFLIDRNPELARRVAALLWNAIQSLEVFPMRGRPSSRPGLRELVVPFGRSAYVIRYAHLQSSDEVVILRIWHGREDRD